MKKNLIPFVTLILLSAVAVYLYLNNRSGTVKKELCDFAVKDTAAINKLFLADREGNRATLTRQPDNSWKVNNTYKAKSSAVATLLATINSLDVKSPVGKNLYNTTIKLMSSHSVKIEIYQHDKLTKTYYVGHPTMDNTGTFMYLEGSSVPFIMWIPGFNGFLTSRYFADPLQWRDPAIFRFIPQRIVEVEVTSLKKPEYSFRLSRGADSSYAITLLSTNKILAPTEPIKIRNFLMKFQNTNYLLIDTRIARKFADSLVANAAFATIHVKDDAGYQKDATCYRIPVTAATKNGVDPVTGKNRPYDPDNFYLKLNQDTSWYMAQYYHFDPILCDPADFQPGKFQRQARY